MLALLIFLQVEKVMIRESVHQSLVNELELEKEISMTFSNDEAKDLEWEHSKEFELKGEMYDVVRSKKMRDSITYFVYHDVKETVLNRKIDQLLANELNSNQDRKDRKQTINNWSKNLFCNNDFILNNLKSPYRKISKLQIDPDSVLLSKDSPPPELM